ncbi:MAG: type I 3-dehydroquinate dehydratase [Oscillospiraceae bacterium]|nr:type I 3-dehydroquinate dehydratase [Oscillospiraceae bacterium]
MENTLSIRAVTVGAGGPKICAPLLGQDISALFGEIKDMQSVPFDLLEWLADFFAHVSDHKVVLEALTALRAAVGEDIPLLFTFRTVAEGGCDRPFPLDQYESLLMAVIDSGRADLIDVELNTGDTIVRSVTATAGERGVPVVLSHHNFRETPERETIIAILMRMLQYDVPISKIAVMPQCRQDVLALMSAVIHMNEHHPERLNIAIAMGELGLVTRLNAGFLGSILTFGTGKSSSAPGQIGVADLRRALDIVGDSPSQATPDSPLKTRGPKGKGIKPPSN